jgi:hypothetical protein
VPGPEAASAQVIALLKGAEQAMMFTRAKMMAALGVMLALCCGVGLAVQDRPGREEGPKAPAAKVEGAPAGDPLAPVLRAKLRVAADGYKTAYQELLAGRRDREDVDLPTWSKRWLEAERELKSTRAEQLAALEAHLERMREFEKIRQAGHDAGRVTLRMLLDAQFAKLEAEAWVLRARSGK